jgi:hypothetical protein
MRIHAHVSGRFSHCHGSLALLILHAYLRKLLVHGARCSSGSSGSDPLLSMARYAGDPGADQRGGHIGCQQAGSHSLGRSIKWPGYCVPINAVAARDSEEKTPSAGSADRAPLSRTTTTTRNSQQGLHRIGPRSTMCCKWDCGRGRSPAERSYPVSPKYCFPRGSPTRRETTHGSRHTAARRQPCRGVALPVSPRRR